MRRLLDGAILLAVGTAALYSVSTAYYQGYLGALNLNPAMMERSVHQVLYGGLLVSFAPVFIGLFLAAIMLYLYFYALLPAYVDYMRKGVGSKRRILKIKRFIVGKRVPADMEKRGRLVFVSSLVFLVACLFFIVSLMWAESKGMDKGEAVMEGFLKGRRESGNSVVVTVDGQEKEVFFLACGSENCAGIDYNTSYVYYFPQETGYSFKPDGLVGEE